MEEDLFKRNRRNFVAIGMAILVINLFGWSFPDKVTFFGNDFQSSGTAVHLLARILVIYWGWEYWISFRGQIGWWRNEWRKVLLQHVQFREDLREQVNPTAVVNIKTQNPSLELVRTQLEWRYLSASGILNMDGHGILSDPNMEYPTHTQTPASFSIEYKKIRRERLLATIKFMMSNPRAFNLWVPWFIGGMAILTEFTRALAAINSS